MRVTPGPVTTGSVDITDGLFDARFRKAKDNKSYAWFEPDRNPAAAGQFVQWRFRNPSGSGKTAFITSFYLRSNLLTRIDMGAIVSPAAAALASAGQQAVRRTGQAASAMSTTFALNVAGPFTSDGDMLYLEANVMRHYQHPIILTANSSATWAGISTLTTTSYSFRLEWYEE